METSFYKPRDGLIHPFTSNQSHSVFKEVYYWYEHNSKSTDSVPEWVNQMLNSEQNVGNCAENTELLQGDPGSIEEAEETASETDLMESGGVVGNQEE